MQFLARFQHWCLQIMQNWIHATNQKEAAHSWIDLLLRSLAAKPHSTSSIFQIFNTVKNCFVRMNHHTRRLTKQSPFSCNASIVVFPKQLADPFFQRARFRGQPCEFFDMGKQLMKNVDFGLPVVQTFRFSVSGKNCASDCARENCPGLCLCSYESFNA